MSGSRHGAHIATGLVLLLFASVVGPWAALAQGPMDASPSAPPGGAPADPVAPSASVTPDAEDMPAFLAPTWSRVAIGGRSPAGREDHTWTVDEDGASAYLFGGRDGGRVHDDLWRFDLASDTWTRLRPEGPRPAARFGHAAAWAPGVGLVLFGGQRGSDFFDDLWAFHPVDGRWRRLPGRGARPAARYGTCLVVVEGRLLVSHGFTFRGRFDDTRAYDLRRERWSDVTPGGRRPGARCLHDCFLDAAGGLVLYGGQDDDDPSLGDIWALGPRGRWSRETHPPATPRRLYAATQAGSEAWVLGGAGRDGQPLDDLWQVDRETLAFSPLRPVGESPPARWGGTLIADPGRGRLLLHGGTARAAFSDLWQLAEEAAADPGPPA